MSNPLTRLRDGRPLCVSQSSVLLSGVKDRGPEVVVGSPLGHGGRGPAAGTRTSGGSHLSVDDAEPLAHSSSRGPGTIRFEGDRLLSHDRLGSLHNLTQSLLNASNNASFFGNRNG